MLRNSYPQKSIEEILAPDGRLKKLVRKYKLVTPIYGGGSQPVGKDHVYSGDPHFGIRPSEIKGQLRFWWRALFGYKAEGSLEKLLDIEKRIFGGPGEEKGQGQGKVGASKIIVHVNAHSLVEKVATGGNQSENLKQTLIRNYIRPVFSLRKKDHPLTPRYVAFPLREGGLVLWVEDPFEITFVYPEHVESDFLGALLAWETFGGIGARTRRGFGAIRPIESSAPIPNEFSKYLHRSPDGWPEGVPKLYSEEQYYKAPLPFVEIVDKYQKFRQYRPDLVEKVIKGRRVRVPGRNRWPEPGAIRWLYKRGYEKPQIFKFPRAQFGLPLPFHFLGEKDCRKQDLKPVLNLIALEEEKPMRLASPLIIRPKSNKETWLLILDAPRLPPKNIARLKLSPSPCDPSQAEPRIYLDAHEVEYLVENEGLKALAPNGEPIKDPVKAFFEWIKKEVQSEEQ